MSTTFGKYKLVQRIGGGQLSQVFRVERLDIPGETGIVLKRVNPRLIGDLNFVQMVVREAGILSRIDHPRLCECQEMGTVDGCAFLTLSLVKGCTLRALMRRVSQLEITLPTSAVVSVVYQLAEVLDHLHRKCDRPLIHLDLSPQNVMVTQTGDIKLIDFGIARYVDGNDPPPLGGRIAGTIGYMSPEQAKGFEALTPFSDQYGLGILLWEMSATQRLFKGNTPETWERMRQGDVPFSHSMFTHRPESLVTVMKKMLEPVPQNRYPNLEETTNALTNCSSSFSSGNRPLAALVSRLMTETSFDPFDVHIVKEPEFPPIEDIPTGDTDDEPSYEELEIHVETGLGSPTAQIRSIIPGNENIPSSPFLEDIETNPSTEIDLNELD